MSDPEYQRQWRAKNPESALLSSRKWRLNNLDKAREASRRWNRNNPDKVNARKEVWKRSLGGRYSNLLSNAKTNNRTVELTLEQWIEIIKQPCYYCGDPVLSEINGYGIDRLDSSSDYFLSNCVPCCSVCNGMKSNLPVEIFLDQIKKIAKEWLVHE